MKSWQQRALAILSAVILACIGQASLAARPWPSRSITIMVGYPPGGGADIMARLVGQKMGQELGQAVVVEDRPGSTGQIAAGVVARSAPDGYTALVDASAFAINLGMYPKLPYKSSSFETVGVMATLPLVVAVNPHFPARDVSQLIARARAKPGGVFYATSGNSSLMHIAGALFEERTGVKLTQVPYKGAGQALNDLVSGQVPLYFGNAAATLPFVKDGRLRALAVTSGARIAELPGIPTLGQAGVTGMELYEWNAMFVPAGTPAPVVERLSSALRKALASPEVIARLHTLTAHPFTGTRADSVKFVREETARFGKVIRDRKIAQE
jgi:tripartite-type tricarboxylate transporter receptor subunit TctC